MDALTIGRYGCVNLSPEHEMRGGAYSGGVKKQRFLGEVVVMDLSAIARKGKIETPQK